MKPIPFKEYNKIIAKNQPEYLDLPVHMKDGVATSCWKLSIIDKIRIIFTGKVYLSIWTFDNPLQPQLMSIDNLTKEKEYVCK